MKKIIILITLITLSFGIITKKIILNNSNSIYYIINKGLENKSKEFSSQEKNAVGILILNTLNKDLPKITKDLKFNKLSFMNNTIIYQYDIYNKELLSKKNLKKIKNLKIKNTCYFNI